VRPEPATILLVDDEEDVLELVREILASAGFSTLPARNGEEAVKVMERQPHIELVITDVMMPDYDGPTLARRIARDWPGVPVLFMTGYPTETLKSLTMLPEGNPPIQKPFPIKDLVRKVRKALKHPS